MIGLIVTPVPTQPTEKNPEGRPGFPEPELVLETLRRGLEAHPDAVWVVKQGDAYSLQFCAQVGITPVLLPSMKESWGDRAAEWRTIEMKTLPDWLLVFAKTGSTVADNFKQSDRVRVVVRGKAKAKSQASRRKPVGV